MITEEEVKMALDEPDSSEDSIRGRRNVYKKMGDKILKVRYKYDREDIVVITAMVKGG